MSVGTTRLNGRAGVEMSIIHYLAGDLAELIAALKDYDRQQRLKNL